MGFLDWAMGNSISGDAEGEEKLLRDCFPTLLQEGERVVFAFLKTTALGNSYKSFLNDRRLIIHEVRGLTGSSVKYKSFAFNNIKAWAVCTAGGVMDTDCELIIYPTGMSKIEIEFSKNKVDLFAIQQFLGNSILPKDEVRFAFYKCYQ